MELEMLLNKIQEIVGGRKDYKIDALLTLKIGKFRGIKIKIINMNFDVIVLGSGPEVMLQL